MIAAIAVGALAVCVGGLALGADAPEVGVLPPAPAFARIAPAGGVQLADNDKGEGSPGGEYHGRGHEGNKGHGEEHGGHPHREHWDHREDKYHMSEEERERNYAGPFFRPAYIRYFHDCYGGGDVRNLPPGLRKQVERTGHLPPGLEKHLERDGTLPPGLEKRMIRANPCIMRHIGRLPVDSRLYMFGRDAYLINYHTHRIIDILRNVF
jgi:hypothetical protein